MCVKTFTEFWSHHLDTHPEDKHNKPLREALCTWWESENEEEQDRESVGQAGHRVVLHTVDRYGDIVPVVQPEEVTEMRHILQGIRAVIADDSHWARKIDQVLRKTGDK